MNFQSLSHRQNVIVFAQILESEKENTSVGSYRSMAQITVIFMMRWYFVMI